VSTLTEVAIPVDQGRNNIAATLSVPDNATGVIVFAHGSGSSRHSPRNQVVAEHLQNHGFATVLLDLLTAEEDEADQRTAELRFDIELLAGRLRDGCDWVGTQPALADLGLGLFGSSTGAAAALMVAAERPSDVGAVVSRGGRPDLAGSALSGVRAPTLLIVGGNDEVVIGLNEEAAERLPNSQVTIVPGATHLFEEPGKLGEVMRVAEEWFEQYLPRS
jgi:dienelactone hydrolase